jgi:hypothetical protein
MSMIKYSIGQITSVEDKEGVEERELATAELTGRLIICKKCGIQHMISKGDSVICCGDEIRFN